MSKNDVPLPFTSARPMPSRQQTTTGTLKRGKTLTRPERHVAPAPLIAPPEGYASNAPASATILDWWRLWSYATTFWAPPVVLRWFGIKEQQSRQAWREKVTLCWIAVVMGGIVGFVTMGLQRALCPEDQQNNSSFLRLGETDLTVSISGWAFNISSSLTQDDVDFYSLSTQMPGQDVSNLFIRNLTDFPSCTSDFRYATTPLCKSSAVTGVTENGTLQDCPLAKLSDDTLSDLNVQNTSLQEGYSWDQVSALDDYMVLDGFVLNMTPYLDANPTAIDGDVVDAIIRQMTSNQSTSGKDTTRLFYNNQVAREAISCLQERYSAGKIDKVTPGCFVASLFLYVSLGVILSVVFVRFAMACVFNWFLSARLVLPPKNLSRTAISPAVMPEGANISVNNRSGTAPWAGGSAVAGSKKLNKLGKPCPSRGPSPATTTRQNDPLISLSRIGAELFAVCLITCYSEGEDSIRGTMESIAATNYSDARKLIYVVCDGMITGAGEKRSTPDICVGMLDADPRFGNPQPMGYIAVGSGAKRENRAMVYAGHYVTRNGHRTPTLIIVKCGMPSEAQEKKPGNRGKRDSQLVLMNFFSRVTYNDRMTPLDFDMFRKVQTLMGVTPDYFEVVLMVDADTRVYPDSLKHLVNCMHHDNMIMGVCGETRIANKRQSWVTAIQVFEYFISHHLVKAFESVFGGVTCLPGCFSMYRIKARRDEDNDWVPILVKPEIVNEYSQCEVETLHEKNLLLLGEDRFLSTIMLRTFPRRKNIFLPQARCRTVAPDTFSVLLSQRRRWINSTVHNLMELVRVRNLCGTFCFSMQFVIFMDLVGTVVLPVAICLTIALIVNSIITPPKSFEEAIPLLLLAVVLGLPAILILITTRKVIYVAWMLVYLLALPIWNFVLPVYSFWHFDDFSWGETRKVEGETVGKGHDDSTAVFMGTTIPLRRWEDWEKSRLRKIRREEKRRRDMERQFGAGFHGDPKSPNGGGGGLGANLGVGGPKAWTRSEYDSDSGSVFSSEEDMWGGEVGGYNENNPSFPPPPIALPPNSPAAGPGETIGMDEMAAMLDSGFDDTAAPPPRTLRPLKNPTSPLHRHQHDFNTPPAAQLRFNLSDTQPGSYVSIDRQGEEGDGQMPVSEGSVSSSVESRPQGGGHAKKRSGGAGKGYGPLGPLDERSYPGGRGR
ncbi:chitin synthase 1 [Cryptococcus amylolentus CBS 6039]|uniref:chitin synthase n=1 Tax=Cryptococcus amylolentus CBS 6039 TaxID=1295533 RepID=A0A1E3HM00_9TREE|nr:chitin synthase 1 [Cryptococcus amylolentus CBS 6039]ODN77368.1 chitin synthase 1 [Cryptococcus amylolentus CBS 6039]